MSRATITLPNELLDELMRTVGTRSKTEAVILAIKDVIRLKKIEKIKALAGSIEFACSRTCTCSLSMLISSRSASMPN